MTDETVFMVAGRGSGKTHQTLLWAVDVHEKTGGVPRIVCAGGAMAEEIRHRLVHQFGMDPKVAGMIPLPATGPDRVGRALRGSKYWAIDDLDVLLRVFSADRPGLVTATGVAMRPAEFELPEPLRRFGDTELGKGELR